MIDAPKKHVREYSQMDEEVQCCSGDLQTTQPRMVMGSRI